jgi:hypothetical protein
MKNDYRKLLRNKKEGLKIVIYFRFLIKLKKKNTIKIKLNDEL